MIIMGFRLLKFGLAIHLLRMSGMPPLQYQINAAERAKESLTIQFGI